MSTIALKKTGYKSFSGSGKKLSLTERFKNYVMENCAVIVSGMMMMMMMTGNTNAYSMYQMLSR